MALFYIIYEITGHIFENHDFFIPLAFYAPVREVPVKILPSRLVWKN